MYIVLFSQHLILDSLIEKLRQENIKGEILFLTTQFLFEHERARLTDSFPEAQFSCFADFLTDEDMAKCDENAFVDLSMEYESYLQRLKNMKNELVYAKIKEAYPSHKGFIFCDDLGIDGKVWQTHGFVWLSGEYYYPQRRKKGFKYQLKRQLKKYKLVRILYGKIRSNYKNVVEDVYVAHYQRKICIYRAYEPY